MHKIHVLKPFIFSSLPAEGHKLPVERHFAKGDHEIDDAMAAHPWIAKHYADGHIERPEQAQARAEAAAKAAERAAEEAAHANRLGEEAVARITAQAAKTGKASAAEIEHELNTPVNVLKVKQGKGLNA